MRLIIIKQYFDREETFVFDQNDSAGLAAFRDKQIKDIMKDNITDGETISVFYKKEFDKLVSKKNKVKKNCCRYLGSPDKDFEDIWVTEI
jgi:hypothetical protein